MSLWIEWETEMENEATDEMTAVLVKANAHQKQSVK